MTGRGPKLTVLSRWSERQRAEAALRGAILRSNRDGPVPSSIVLAVVDGEVQRPFMVVVLGTDEAEKQQ